LSGIWTAHNVKASNDGKEIERQTGRDRDRQAETERQRHKEVET
jgi:hypothetical protein